MRYIDLRSDTVTQPTKAMRDAMYICEVGDDVFREDPSINELEGYAAKQLGKEAAMFVSSGTMGNQLAILCYTERGDEVIVSDSSHIFVAEVGAAAALSSAQLREIHFQNGIFDADLIDAVFRPEDIHYPNIKLICMENALSNGRVVPLENMKAVYELSQRRGIHTHVDGARLFNAAVALGVDVAEFAACTDSVTCCLSKGLCAPAGAVLAGTKDFIEKARRYRKMLGGGMRQIGFLGAAGLIAMRDMPAHLVEDHNNAKLFAKLISDIPGVEVDMDSVQINMVFAKIDRPQEILNNLQCDMLKFGVRIGGYKGARTGFRFVTNHNVTRDDIYTAVQALKECLS